MNQSFYSAAEVAVLAKQFDGDVVALALSMLPEAAKWAVAPVSNFHVGAIAIDVKGNFYFGANQESAAAMAQTVHAEQSAVAHAWASGATELAHMVVNYTPCGHCRQFLNELRGAEKLLIHLPHSRNNRLHDYLPDSFGADDLGITTKLLDPQNHALTIAQPQHHDEWANAAIQAAKRSHAPYTLAYAGVALHMANGDVYLGSYAENAAYNPSLPPLQAALNHLRLNRANVADVVTATLACTAHGGHAAHSQALWQSLSDVPLRVIILATNHS